MPRKKSAVGCWRYKLLHNCSKPGCEGTSGDVVELDDENHQWFQKHVVPARGAKFLGIVNSDDVIERSTDEPLAEARESY